VDGGSTFQRQVVFCVLTRFALRRYLESSLYTGGKSD